MAQPAKKADAKPSAALAPASESTDPAVHQLLAERQTAQMNGDAEAASAADKQLAELGYR